MIARSAALLALIVTGCAGVATMPFPEPVPALAEAPRIDAVAITSAPVSTLWYTTRVGARCSVIQSAMDGTGRKQRDPGFCADHLQPLDDGSILATGGQSSVWLDPSGTVTPADAIVARSRTLFVDHNHVLHEDGNAVTTCFTSARFRPKSSALVAVSCPGADGVLLFSGAFGEARGEAAGEAGKVKSQKLTAPFAAIDSFDFSPDGKEVVFSAKRDKSFDIGLVSADGSDVHWFPADPGDETHVRWATRTNKVAYFLRAADTALVRTVHTPTATQVSTDFPWSTVRDLAWDPSGDKYAVVVSSVTASDHIELMRYDGTLRTTIVPSAATLATEPEPLGSSADVMLLRPSALRYNEQLPLVIWTGEANPYEWDDVRGGLHAADRLVSAITSRTSAELDAAFWKAILALKWIDPARVYVVGQAPLPATAGAPPLMQISSATSADLRSGRYLKRKNDKGLTQLLVPAGEAGSVKSLAAALIHSQLKGTKPSNDQR